MRTITNDNGLSFDFEVGTRVRLIGDVAYMPGNNPASPLRERRVMNAVDRSRYPAGTEAVIVRDDDGLPGQGLNVQIAPSRERRNQYAWVDARLLEPAPAVLHTTASGLEIVEGREYGINESPVGSGFRGVTRVRVEPARDTYRGEVRYPSDSGRDPRFCVTRLDGTGGWGPDADQNWIYASDLRPLPTVDSTYVAGQRPTSIPPESVLLRVTSDYPDYSLAREGDIVRVVRPSEGDPHRFLYATVTPNPSHDSSRARDGREYLSLDSVVVAGAAGERPASPERPLVDRVRDAFRDYTDANALTDRGEVVWRAGMAARSAKFEHIVRGITHIIERWPTDDDPRRLGRIALRWCWDTRGTGDYPNWTIARYNNTGLCEQIGQWIIENRAALLADTPVAPADPSAPRNWNGIDLLAWSFVRADFDRLWRYIARGAEAAGHERNWRAARDRYIASSPTALPLEGDPSLVEQFVIDDAIYVRKEQVDAEMDRFRTLCMEEANNSSLCMEYDRVIGHADGLTTYFKMGPRPVRRIVYMAETYTVERYVTVPISTSDEDAIAQARRTNRDWVGQVPTFTDTSDNQNISRLMRRTEQTFRAVR